jgi:hypothetical protein
MGKATVTIPDKLFSGVFCHKHKFLFLKSTQKDMTVFQKKEFSHPSRPKSTVGHWL